MLSNVKFKKYEHLISIISEGPFTRKQQNDQVFTLVWVISIGKTFLDSEQMSR